MARGKETCRILKEIRRKIADANGIEYITSECRYKGDCLGTCPKCEAEVRYLEQQLRARSLAGKAVALAGISAASLAMLMPMTSAAQGAQEQKPRSEVSTQAKADSIIVRGVVLAGDTLPDGRISEDPIIGAGIKIHGEWLSTDLDGLFEVSACIGDSIEFDYISFESQTIVVTADMQDVRIVLKPTYVTMGEHIIIHNPTPGEKHYLDLNVIDEKGEHISEEDITVSRVRVDEDGAEESYPIYPYHYDDKHPCRIYWESASMEDEDGNLLKEATLHIEAKGYDDPVTIKVKYPKTHSRKTIKFKPKKK